MRSAVRPRIGVTSRFRQAIRSHSIHEGYVEQVVRAGGLPLVIPCTDADGDLCASYLSVLDGLLLTGGEDMDPAQCRGTVRRPGYTYHPRRDAFETRLAGAALEAGLPTLGICRGAQVLHTVTGNPLIGHIPDVNGGRVAHRTSLTETSRHSVTLTEGSKVARAYGDRAYGGSPGERTLKVTSYHHQGLGEQTPGGIRWRVTARADDSLAEAIEREEDTEGDAWAVGVLWHPELPADDGPADGTGERTDPLIAAFVAAAGAS
ncbi:gamma-glutamyl-gamma-aminobutyrate hydrolase family protein [Streptomyces roseoverticillatus]|uniref:gamma-glutamyl-gamma-aminobutyrate hydrolase family protein n=1 Tax=Streptomyces roseoverticillatus TaxID=66429 RepID=UPI0022858AE2|nr:gamma-glutamyl-gamma-aminobutyrate hydrolase family protein [Streptomyces roseoverticillatus]MCF3102079.1 gamma-glutamyl-gamma-aminobutyrate hydrolase family protein [Streptomyces roseoverticillatus]